jgi:two-component system LytT family sensor kinase
VKKWIPVLLHVLVWFVLLANGYYDSISGHFDYFEKAVKSSGLNRYLFYFIFNFTYLIDFLVAFYGAYFFVAPFLFLQKKYFRALLNLGLVLAAMVLTRYLGEFHILLPYLKFDNYLGHAFQLWDYSQNCILYTYRYCLFGLVIYFIEYSNRLEKEKKEIEKEKIQAELSFLRSQINPHFLFNTINDIYSLTYQKDDRAPEALLKLSSILRYMLHDGISEKVMLQKELSYLEDYIELQRIGLKGKLYINYTVEGKIDQQQITPLLLIPFVENIIKHGVIDDTLNPAVLNIKISNSDFNLYCRNKIRQRQKDNTGGIGLSNVKRRLELLYPEKHQFTIQNDIVEFNCSLQLNLNK